MATPIASDLGTLLNALKNYLIAEEVFNTSCVYLGLTSEMPDSPPGTPFGVVVPGDQKPDQGVVRGGGNSTMLMSGEFAVHIWVQLNTDETPRSDNWLTDITLGSLATVSSLVQALQLYQVVDSNGNGLTYEGVRLVSLDMGKRISFPKPQTPSAPGWGCITTRWLWKWWFNLAT